MNFEEDKVLNVPVTAVEIKITSLINPFIIRMYESKGYIKKENDLSKKLQMKFRIKKPSERKKYHVGNMVLTSNTICEDGIELPGWLCRGILGHQNPHTLKYPVFLVDYGYAIDLEWNEFVRINKTLVPDEFLTSTIGLYDLIPAQASLLKVQTQLTKEDDKIVVSLLNEWSEKAIKFTKQLINAASTIMFDPLAVDENNKVFGELYLFIEDTIVKLRDLLVENFHAVYISNEIETLVESFKKNPKEERDDYSFPYSPSKDNTPNANGEGEDSQNTSKDISNEDFGNFDNDIGCLSPQVNKKLKLLKYKEDGQTMLVQSNIKVNRLHSLEAAPFPMPIHRALRSYNNNITGIRMIQSYMWPAIMKGANVVAICSSGNGKTYGHAVAVSSALAQNDSIPTGNTPSALILCSSTKDVFEVAELYGRLLMSLECLHVVAAYNGKDDKAIAAEIFNGCQILISTPPFISRLMSKYRDTILNLKQIRYLVLDKADIILNKYSEHVLKVIVKYGVIDNKQRVVDGIPLQFIAVANQWTVPLKKFTQTYISNPYTCIDSCMEAAIYTGTKSRSIMVASNNKAEKVASFLGKTESMQRTMIVCTSNEEVIMLEEYLKSQSKNVMAIHDQMDCLVVQEEKKFWEECVSGTFPILICTDEVLSELSINNVEHLIHFSFPPTSKRQFHFRFSTLMDNLMMGNKETKITLIIDESNELQLKSIIDPMQRLGINVPEAWINAVEYYVATEDMKKESYHICDKVKALGFCPNSKFCPYRHCILNKIDQPVTDIQVGDEITCIVNYIHDASHFSVRIVDYTSFDPTTDTKEKRYVDAQGFFALQQKLQTYYSNLKHRRHSKNIDVGKMFVSETSVDKFQRVEVIRIELRDSNEQPLIVTIRCVDSGIIIAGTSVHKLYEIPETFKKVPSHIVEVFLTGIAPFDDEFDWNEMTNSVAENWFIKYYKEKSTYIHAKVLLHVGNTLWIDSLEVRTKVSGYRTLTASSLKTYLLENNYAVVNEKHLDMLQELCKKGLFSKIDSAEPTCDEIDE